MTANISKAGPVPDGMSYAKMGVNSSQLNNYTMQATCSAWNLEQATHVTSGNGFGLLFIF